MSLNIRNRQDKNKDAAGVSESRKAFFDHAIYANNTDYIHTVVSMNLEKEEYAGKDILDYGCGCGDVALYLANNGGKRVTGADIGKNNIAHARRNSTSLTNVEFIEVDFHNYDIEENGYDVIWSDTVIEVLEVPITELINQFYKALKPNGVLYISFTERTLSNQILYFALNLFDIPGFGWGFSLLGGLAKLKYKLSGVPIDQENLKNKLSYLKVPFIRLVCTDEITTAMQTAGFELKYFRTRIKSDLNSPPHIELKAIRRRPSRQQI